MPSMSHPARWTLVAALAAWTAVAPLAAQDATLIVTVIDERTGETATGLDANQFSVVDGDVTLRVVSADQPGGPVDVLLLVDTSMVGEAVRPVAAAIVEELGEGEAMAVVAYDEGAELLQDFTSEKQYLRRALDRSEYGNLPRVHDALFASIDGGFDASSHRKAVILLSAGMTARSRVSEAEVVSAARARGVSLFPVFAKNDARSLLRRFALKTGGAAFAARRLKLEPRMLAKRVFEAIRNSYELAVSGVLALGDRIQATVTGEGDAKAKLTASVLPVD